MTGRQQRVRRTTRAVVGVAAAMLLTACGGGSGGSSASETASSEPSEDTSASPSESAGAVTCPTGATCYDFATADGWPQANETDYFAGQDAYGGGSYRFGARADGLYTLAAPVAASTLSPEYAVDVSATVTLGPQVADGSSAGLRCWAPEDSRGGFAALLDGSDVVLGVVGADGAFTEIDRAALSAPVGPGGRARLGLSCVQDSSSGNVEAALVVSVDDEALVEAAYGNGAANVGWEAQDGVGIAVEGMGADAFFDDLVVAPAG